MVGTTISQYKVLEKIGQVEWADPLRAAINARVEPHNFH